MFTLGSGNTMLLNGWTCRGIKLGSCPHRTAHPLLQVKHRVVRASAKSSKKRNKQRQQQLQGPSDIGLDDYEVVTSSGAPVLPKAPSPKAIDSLSQSDTDEQPYSVFAPKPSNVKKTPWSWGEDGENNDEPPLPEWNPRTGFMKQPLQGPAASLQELGRDSRKPSPERQVQDVNATADSIPEPDSPHLSLLTPSADATTEDLPSVTQSQVMTSCIGTTFWMTVMAFFLRSYAQANAPLVLGTDETLLAQYLTIPSGLDNWANVGILLGCAGLVTGARFTLQNVWPEFRTSMERSNKQILTPLNWFDIVLIALMTGVSEELLFRGAIIPASFLDWRGVALSGVIFGLLHNSGGRNLAFAAWASGVGCLYGAAFLYTHNIWVPASAHVLANFASAAFWKTQSKSSSSNTALKEYL